MEDDCDSWKERLKVDTVRLSQFLLSAGQVCRIYLRFEVLITQTMKVAVDTHFHLPQMLLLTMWMVE